MYVNKTFIYPILPVCFLQSMTYTLLHSLLTTFAHSCTNYTAFFLKNRHTLHILCIFYTFCIVNVSIFHACFLTFSTYFLFTFLFPVTIFIVIHQNTKANSVYVKAYFAINQFWFYTKKNSARCGLVVDMKIFQIYQIYPGPADLHLFFSFLLFFTSFFTSFFPLF